MYIFTIFYMAIIKGPQPDRDLYKTPSYVLRLVDLVGTLGMRDCGGSVNFQFSDSRQVVNECLLLLGLNQ